MKKFLEEFKAFALRGNVMDMAIGVIIGGAFTTIVTSLTENLINPILGLAGGTDLSGFVLSLGGIDNADNLAQLQKNIDAALAADQK